MILPRYRITPPAEVVSRLNRHFLSNTGASQFFTMIYGILDKKTREFRYVAGHLGSSLSQFPLKHWRNRRHPSWTSPPATYEEHTLTLSQGGRLFLCTDGISGAQNEAKEEFGCARLLEALDVSRDLTLGDALSSVFEDVEKWSAPARATDDVSILAIECCA